MNCPYPDPSLSEVGPHCDLLSGAHVWVAVPLEGGLQLLELLAGEVSPLPPLLLLQRAIISTGLIQLVLVGFFCVCRQENAFIRTLGGAGVDRVT